MSNYIKKNRLDLNWIFQENKIALSDHFVYLKKLYMYKPYQYIGWFWSFQGEASGQTKIGFIINIQGDPNTSFLIDLNKVIQYKKFHLCTFEWNGREFSAFINKKM